MTDNATLTPLPTPATEPIEEATPDEGAAPSEPVAAQEAEAEPQAETPKYPWAEIADPRDILDLDDVKPVLERRDRRTEENLRTQMTQEFQQKTQSWEASNLYQTLNGHLGRLMEKLEDGNVELTDRQIDKLNKLTEPYEPMFKESLRREGSDLAGRNLLRVMLNALPRRQQEEFEDVVTSLRGPVDQQWETVLDHYTEGKVAPLKAENQSLKDQIAALRAKVRGEQGGPSLAQGNAGGGGINSLAEAERRYNLPAGHPEKIDHATFKDHATRFGATYVK